MDISIRNIIETAEKNDLTEDELLSMIYSNPINNIKEVIFYLITIVTTSIIMDLMNKINNQK